ncbi:MULTISPECIES: hypothetical protein [unclassified Arsenophonus]|uniref:hypothetical protein n=1 Tax=unclassified Arsenophonus TaxID=2627083 RepID=UPI002859B04B|nr:hypothetical protein [Arsenophonus sp.]MDR5609948.1 hypothetical protein [Arsenophonus sp.]MDR5613620.1 hypothetical protein [Arsenophonus sp.]
MGLIDDCFRRHCNIQQAYTDKTKQVVTTDFDKLSQAMNQWGVPSNKSEIEKQLQILSELYIDNIPKIAYGKILAFIRLAELAGEKYRYDFNIEVVKEYNNQVKLLIENIFSQSFTIFDDLMTELHNALKIPLMNGAQYLDIDSNIDEKQLIKFIKDNVKLTINKEEKRGFNIAGVTKGNQERLDISDFPLEILDILANNSQLLQTFIMAKMKCFDYFIGVSTHLMPITLALSIDAKGEIIAKSLKKQFDDEKNSIEKKLFELLKESPKAFADYCNHIMNKNV